MCRVVGGLSPQLSPACSAVKPSTPVCPASRPILPAAARSVLELFPLLPGVEGTGTPSLLLPRVNLRQYKITYPDQYVSQRLVGSQQVAQNPSLYPTLVVWFYVLPWSLLGLQGKT